ncbi:hypothetical protein ColTof3_00800 [Colletotrichum tofieldiae]|nr:hypothetical protein ColTof3_00800 [Colletotrichum tofieldiae]
MIQGMCVPLSTVALKLPTNYCSSIAHPAAAAAAAAATQIEHQSVVMVTANELASPAEVG